MVCGQRVTAPPASARPAPAMKDNEKRTNDMQQETTAPREAGPILCRFMRETDVPACAAIEACADDLSLIHI